MLSRVKLQGFQSHVDTVLQLAPGVNAIVGESDAGKSALIRALYWLRFNKPQGDDFRSHGASQTVAEVTTTDGRTIRRVKSSGVNRYILDGRDKDPIEAFGTGVPEGVVEAFNMPDICWERQMEIAYLLKESPGEVARRLNEVANLQVIDRSITYLNASLRQAKQTEERTKKEIAELQEELEGYEVLDEMEVLIAKAEDASEKARKARLQEVSLSRTLSALVAVEEAISALGWTHTALEEVDAALALAETAQRQRKEAEGVLDHVRDLEAAEERVRVAGNRLQLEEASLKALTPNKCPLCGAVRRTS